MYFQHRLISFFPFQKFIFPFYNESALLFGETGAGKSSFINAFFEKKVAGVSGGAEKCTKEVIPIKDKRGSEEYTFIDTPGLNDIEKEEEKNKKEIMDTIENEIKGNSEVTIKCILIFSEYTHDRLTGSYINALIFLMDLFPFKDFWKHVIIIRSKTTYINQYEENKERIDKMFAKKKQSLLDGIIENEDLVKKMKDLNINIPDKINMKFVDSYDDLKDKINDNKYMKETMNEIGRIITEELKPLLKNIKISNQTKYIGSLSFPYKLIEYEDDNGKQQQCKKYVGNPKNSVIAKKAISSPKGYICKKGKFQYYQDYIIFYNEKGEYLSQEKNGDTYEDKAGNEKNTELLK